MSDIEKKFFETMKIKPTMLCQCSFKNLKDYRYEYGDDCCEHLDDFEFSCKDCEKSIQNIPLYPPITSDIVLGLIKILIDNGQKLKMFEASEMFRDHTRYIINAENEIRHDIYGTGETLKYAILALCIKLPHISEEIKVLFQC